jgi:benzoate-CoA ligase family protein
MTTPHPSPLIARRAAEMPRRYNAVDILERNLDRFADKIALYSDDRCLTFREVSDEANQVGNALLDLDVRVGEVVGILSPDCAEWTTAFFGTFKVGGVALGLNTLLKAPEYAFMLNDSRVSVLVVYHTLLTVAAQAVAVAPGVRHVIVIGGDPGDYHSYATLIAGKPKTLETVNTHRNELAILNYSSGTTGEPKGIAHPHKDFALSAQLWAVDVLGMQNGDRILSNAKMFFGFGLGGGLLFPWYTGASIVVNPGPPRDTTSVLHMIQRYQPTIFFNAPTGYAAALAIPDLRERFDLSSLRLCVSAGESLPAPIWHGWKERTGVDIIDGIGSTEAFHIFISNRPGDIRPGSTGKPVQGYEVRIVDEDGTPTPRGEVGRLLLKGETTAIAYLNQYQRTKQTFLGEWIDTGDKYRVDEDGYYWHAGRTDDMLKVGGIWVSPTEVESALIAHEAVVECAVVGATDEADLVKPKAFVVLGEAYEASDALADELISYCVEKMAAYKRPRWIVFLDDLPKTATGKIQRFKLR